MNFIQRNPSDLRHQEFHDGEYEYWPLKDSLKTKSISFPAALVSGLEMLAAAAAAGLLAVALMALYVLSSPLAISENSAVINTNIYNNQNDQDVVYTLSFLETPDNVLRDGILLHEEQTLSLWNLNGGTTYLLKYYDSEQNEVGQFRFTTPGEKPSPEEPEPSVPARLPEEPDDDMEKPTSEVEDSSETGDDAPESITETTEPNSNRPPAIFYPRPNPRPDPEEEEDYTPDSVPEPEPTPGPAPEPVPSPEPAPERPPIEIINSNYIESGALDGGDLACVEYFEFRNIPDENYQIEIYQNGVSITPAYADIAFENGTLVIPVESILSVGVKSTTTVTVHTSLGTISKESVLAPPMLDEVVLTATLADQNRYTFTITATVAMTDDTPVTEKMLLQAELEPYDGAEVILLSMEQTDDTQYVAQCTVEIPEAVTKTASVLVFGCWDRITLDVFPQNAVDICEYNILP